MDTILVGKLEQIVSAPRLRRYRYAAQSDLETVALYCWNIQLAEALLPTVAILEVTLRNAIHTTLANHTGSDFWFESVLHPRSYRNIADLISRITQNQGHPPTAGKVISEITFGFWPKLFAKTYHSLWWTPPSPLLVQVLPNVRKMGRDTRNTVQQRLEYFARLRNRCMHHEAVFQGVAPLNRPVLQVDALHGQLLETLGWINTDAADIAGCVDRFNDVYFHGKATVEAELRRRFRV